MRGDVLDIKWGAIWCDEGGISATTTAQQQKKRVKKKEKHTLIFIEAWIIEKISTGCVFCGSAFAFYREAIKIHERGA